MQHDIKNVNLLNALPDIPGDIQEHVKGIETLGYGSMMLSKFMGYHETKRTLTMVELQGSDGFNADDILAYANDTLTKEMLIKASLRAMAEHSIKLLKTNMTDYKNHPNGDCVSLNDLNDLNGWMQKGDTKYYKLDLVKIKAMLHEPKNSNTLKDLMVGFYARHGLSDKVIRNLLHYNELCARVYYVPATSIRTLNTALGPEFILAYQIAHTLFDDVNIALYGDYMLVQAPQGPTQDIDQLFSKIGVNATCMTLMDDNTVLHDHIYNARIHQYEIRQQCVNEVVENITKAIDNQNMEELAKNMGKLKYYMWVLNMKDDEIDSMATQTHSFANEYLPFKGTYAIGDTGDAGVSTLKVGADKRTRLKTSLSLIINKFDNYSFKGFVARSAAKRIKELMALPVKHGMILNKGIDTVKMQGTTHQWIRVPIGVQFSELG